MNVSSADCVGRCGQTLHGRAFGDHQLGEFCLG
jgi:hypothetical protein